ncbi:MAG: aminotransferase [Pseudomonadota bacterium]
MKPRQLTNMQTRDVETLIHPYTNLHAHAETGPHVIERGEGVYVVDSEGRRLLEGMAGLWCVGLGYGNEELVETAREALSRLSYYHLFAGRSYEPAVELAEKLKELVARSVPGAAMARVFYASSGSEANDTQVKLAWYLNNARGRPEKKKIISRVKGYHGVTIVSASLTGLPNNHRAFDLPVDRILHADTPHHWREAAPGESEEAFSARLAAQLEALIEREGPDTIAAMIAEPVMGAGGVIAPPKGYFEAIQPVLARHDIRLIADEVICGFGRTGAWLGSETVGMAPQSISFAKQMTSAYLPLSAVMVDQEMTDALDANSQEIGVFGHGYTYGGHPAACAVGVKTLEIYERIDIVGHVRRIAPLFKAGLERFADHPLVGEARTAGLLGGLELAPGGDRAKTFPPMKVGPKMAAEMLERGVIVRAIGDTIAFCPPMVITEAELEELLAPIEAALDATHAWAQAEGLL